MGRWDGKCSRPRSMPRSCLDKSEESLVWIDQCMGACLFACLRACVRVWMSSAEKRKETRENTKNASTRRDLVVARAIDRWATCVRGRESANLERNTLVYVFLVNSNSSIADFKSIYRYNDNINIIIVIIYDCWECDGGERDERSTWMRKTAYAHKAKRGVYTLAKIRKKKKTKRGIANRAKNTLEKYLPTYKCATTKICIMYTRLLKPFYQICHYLIISVVF